jgi:hypothetical protein
MTSLESNPEIENKTEQVVETPKQVLAPEKLDEKYLVSQEEATSPEIGKLKKLFGHCFEMSLIKDGDVIPVGGSIFSNEASTEIIGDFENFKQFITDTHEAASKYNLPNLKEWLNSQEIKFDEKLFASLFAFTKNLEKNYPDNKERAITRRNLYNEKGKEIKLSDVFNTNSAECAEISALAQKFLQQEGTDSTYFSGDILWNKDMEFSDEHSFIIIQQGNNTYIYDPTNPTNTSSGKFPSIYTTEVNFDEEISKGQKRFVTAKNLLTKEEVFYGVNDGTNVWAEKHII